MASLRFPAPLQNDQLYRPTFPANNREAYPNRLDRYAPRRRSARATVDSGGPLVVAPRALPRVPVSDSTVYRTDGGPTGTPLTGSTGTTRAERRIEALQARRNRVRAARTAAMNATLPGEFDSGSMVPYWGAGVSPGSGATIPVDSALPQTEKEAVPTAIAGAGGVILFLVLGWFAWDLLQRYK